MAVRFGDRGYGPLRSRHGRPPKLTEDQVREIRRRYDAGESPRLIAAAMGCSQGAVSRIGRRQTQWRVDGEPIGRGRPRFGGTWTMKPETRRRVSEALRQKGAP